MPEQSDEEIQRAVAYIELVQNVEEVITEMIPFMDVDFLDEDNWANETQRYTSNDKDRTLEGLLAIRDLIERMAIATYSPRDQRRINKLLKAKNLNRQDIKSYMDLYNKTSPQQELARLRYTNRLTRYMDIITWIADAYYELCDHISGVVVYPE